MFGINAGDTLLSIIVSLPTAILYIALVLLCSSVLNDKQVGGLCGALLTNLTAWLSGIWFDIELLGTPLKNLLAYCRSFIQLMPAKRHLIADIMKYYRTYYGF